MSNLTNQATAIVLAIMVTATMFASVSTHAGLGAAADAALYAAQEEQQQVAVQTVVITGRRMHG